MVGALAPVAIVLGGTLAAALIFSSLWGRFSGRVASIGTIYARDLDVGDIGVKADDLGYMVIAVAAVVWIAIVFILRPTPVFGVLYLAMILLLSAFGVKYYLQARVKKRVNLFRDQFENVMRALVSGVRVGLGLRQALVHVADQSKEPASKELVRVIGAANLGTSILDALDDMSERMPIPETKMMARVIRVQSQSGGDLAGVLEHLADTIRDRRKLQRRMSALTAQARVSAWVLGLLPVAFLAFVLGTQPGLRDATLNTTIGHIVLMMAISLDAAAVFVLYKMTGFDP
jgi:tight adherence protein B